MGGGSLRQSLGSIKAKSSADKLRLALDVRTPVQAACTGVGSSPTSPAWTSFFAARCSAPPVCMTAALLWAAVQLSVCPQRNLRAIKHRIKSLNLSRLQIARGLCHLHALQPPQLHLSLNRHAPPPHLQPTQRHTQSKGSNSSMGQPSACHSRLSAMPVLHGSWHTTTALLLVIDVRGYLTHVSLLSRP